MNVIQFKPLLKPALWGSESWEVSGVEGSESCIDGVSLNHLVATQKEQLVGRTNYARFGNEFPLLIKFIDAHEDLSIQVHPDDETARRQGHERGKTEMWYVVDTTPDAHIRAGLCRSITPEEYKAMVENHTICDALARYDAHPGDCFFLPAGRIHSIGAGCRLAEIQQTSDVTYRIYDFNRRDADGHLRELHTEQAAEAIDYHVEPDYRTLYTPVKNRRVELVRCPFFTTAVYDTDRPLTIDYSRLDSFVILIGLKGEGAITADGERHEFGASQTLLLPAHVREVHVEGTLHFLETYIEETV